MPGEAHKRAMRKWRQARSPHADVLTGLERAIAAHPAGGRACHPAGRDAATSRACLAATTRPTRRSDARSGRAAGVVACGDADPGDGRGPCHRSGHGGRVREARSRSGRHCARQDAARRSRRRAAARARRHRSRVRSAPRSTRRASSTRRQQRGAERRGPDGGLPARPAALDHRHQHLRAAARRAGVDPVVARARLGRDRERQLGAGPGLVAARGCVRGVEVRARSALGDAALRARRTSASGS